MADANSNVVRIKPLSADDLIEWLENNRENVQSFAVAAIVEVDDGAPCIFTGRGWNGDNAEPYAMAGALASLQNQILNEEIE